MQQKNNGVGSVPEETNSEKKSCEFCKCRDTQQVGTREDITAAKEQKAEPAQTVQGHKRESAKAHVFALAPRAGTSNAESSRAVGLTNLSSRFINQYIHTLTHCSPLM